MTQEDKKQARTFGWGLAGIFAIIATIKLIFKEPDGIPWQYYVAAAVAIVNLAAVIVIYPIYKAAIFIAHYLGWFNTRLILGIIFFLVFTPLALIFRLLGKDFLDRKIDRNAASYWIKRKPQKFDPTSVENQF